MSTCSSPPLHGILDYLDENRFFSVLTTSTFVIIGIFLYIVSLYRFFEKEKIPSITQPSAPYGNIKDVIDKDTTIFELISKYYNKLKKRRCKYGGMYLFFRPGVVVTDTALVTDILLNKNIFRDVNNNEEISGAYATTEIIEQYLEKSSNTIKCNFVKSLQTNDGKFENMLYGLVVDSMCIIFGLDRKDITNFIVTTENTITSSSFKYYFNLVYPYFKPHKSQEWNKIIKSNLLNRKKNDIRKNDVLQILIDADENEQNLLDINEFVKNILYSYYSSLYCLYELSNDIDIQKELIGEIRRFNNSDKNLKDLPYLNAVVKGKLY